MKLTFLGTGAGEGYPGLWCECPHCDYARKHGGKNIRTNSSAVIDERLLIDIGPGCFDNAARFGVNLCHVTSLLITHPHEDHLYPQHLIWRRTDEDNLGLPYAEQMRRGGPRFTPIPELSVYGGAFTEKLLSRQKEQLEGARMRFERIEEGVPFQTGAYRVTPVRGNHVERGFSHSYIIEKDGRTMLYALDTGSYDPDMEALLKKYVFNLVVMEGTTGLTEQYGGHMCLVNNVRMLRFFQDNGCYAPDGRFVLTHMSPHWCPPHDWYESIAGAEGVTLAYDGMQIEV